MSAVAAPVESPALATSGLRKSFGRTEALRGIDLRVPVNSVTGFLGPNGAGKSTTMKIVLGLIRPTGGSATVFGLDSRRDGVEVRARIGYLPQDPVFWGHLHVRDILRFTARQYHDDGRGALDRRIDDVVELTGLGGLVGRRPGKLSGGELQRVGIAQAWIGTPDLLILDEPSSGLDPEGRHEVLELLDRLRAETTILYSTHILDDVERLSDHIAVLHRGEIVAQGPTESFLVGGAGAYLLEGSDPRGVVDTLGRQDWVRDVSATAPGQWEITVDDRSVADHRLVRHLVDGGVRIADFRPARHSLEDIYLELVREAEENEEGDDDH